MTNELNDKVQFHLMQAVAVELVTSEMGECERLRMEMECGLEAENFGLEYLSLLFDFNHAV